MSDELRRHTGLVSCSCCMCALIHCGAIDRSWDGWKDVEFAGYARSTLFLLVRMEPPVWPGPRYRWAGCLDWFRVLGEALDFDDAEGDTDGPA
jgi:hypothetical protein